MLCTCAKAANPEKNTSSSLKPYNRSLTTLSVGKVMMEEEVKEEIKEEMETHTGPEEGKFVTLYCVIRD